MNYAAFIPFVLLSAFTPGPNNIMSMTNGTRYGFKKALPFNLGVLTGFSLVMLIDAFFSSLLYDLVPSVKPVMLCIGAAYILFLAWTVIRDKPRRSGKELSDTSLYLSGLILQFVNVKVILYGLTAMSSFVLPAYRNPLAVACFAIVLAAIGCSANICWLLFGSAFQHFFTKYHKAVNIVMSLLLVYCAVTMLLGLRTM